MTEQERIERESKIAGLRQLADFLESNPTAPMPYISDFSVYLYEKADLIGLTKGLGKFDKKYSEWYLSLVKEFGPIKYQLHIGREQICEKKQVGVKKVPAQKRQIIKAQKAHEEPIYEWQCSSLLDPTPNE